jgi:hypothetical protein
MAKYSRTLIDFQISDLLQAHQPISKTMVQGRKVIDYPSTKPKEREFLADKQDSPRVNGRLLTAQGQITTSSPLNSANQPEDNDSIKLSSIDHYSFYQLSKDN